jgi:hypothetical protein
MLFLHSRPGKDPGRKPGPGHDSRDGAAHALFRGGSAGGANAINRLGDRMPSDGNANNSAKPLPRGGGSVTLLRSCNELQSRARPASGMSGRLYLTTSRGRGSITLPYDCNELTEPRAPALELRLIFADVQVLVWLDIRKSLTRSARPKNFDGVDRGIAV